MTCVVERQELETVLTDANQGHLLDHYERLSDDEKSALSETILKSGFDFKHLNHVLRDSLVLLDQSQPDAQGAKDTIRPPTAGEVVDVAALRRSDPAQLQSLEEKGLLEVVARGEAAVLLLAGGSGSRLGFAPPKGMFVNPHLKGNRSLFQWHCERVLKVERLALAALCKESGVSPASIHSRTVSTSSVSTPQVLNRSQHSSNSPSSHPSTPSNATGVFTPRIQVLIMTSEQNNEDIQKFFIKKKYFGLKSDQVHFFQQQSLPCYDEATGKILMASESTMCVAPGGNGGVYASLAAPIRQTTTFGDKKPSSSSIRSDSTPVTETTGSLLDLLTARGVQQVQIFNVDNVLAKVADPLLYGYTRQCNAAVVVKTSSKVSPEERVGVFARRNDRWGVVEYTEIGAHATEVNEDGSLRYNCANISVQNCTIGFLRRAAEEMRQSTLYHAARKRIDTINGPVDGVKLEAFIFDMFYLAEDPSLQAHNTTEYEQAMGFKIMQVAREEEFAPVKNADAPGATDCPLTAAQLLLSLHTHRVEDFLAKRVFSSSQDCLQKLSSNERSGSRIIAALEVLRACSKQVQLSPLVSYDGEGLPPVECYLVDQLVDGRSHIVEVESRNMHRSEKTPSL